MSAPAATPAAPAAATPASATTAIGMTPEAAAKIHALVAEKNQPGAGLRVKVVGGGCSGLTYKMDLDQPRDGDKIFEHEGAKIVVDRKSFLYLKGTILDYHDDLMSSGFNLQNPNVKRSCGCGSSFVV
jgi:iron-sulfur cluster assembly protein